MVFADGGSALFRRVWGVGGNEAGVGLSMSLSFGCLQMVEVHYFTIPISKENKSSAGVSTSLQCPPAGAARSQSINRRQDTSKQTYNTI